MPRLVYGRTITLNQTILALNDVVPKVCLTVTTLGAVLSSNAPMEDSVT